MLRWHGKSNEIRARKLAVEMSANLRLRSRMDDDTHELIVRLCARAGIVMEDASVIALSVARSRDDAILESELEKLTLAVELIKTCIEAASKVAR